MDEVEETKIGRLKKLRNDETQIPINPLQKKVKQLENELKKPSKLIPVDTTQVDTAIVSLMDRFRKILELNRKAKTDGESEVLFRKNSILQLNRRSELLNTQLAEMDKLGNEAQRTLNNAKRAETQVALEREELEVDKRVWFSRLPSLQAKVDLKSKELSGLLSKVSKEQFTISATQRLLRGAELKLLLVKTNTKAHIKLRGEIEAYKQQVFEAKDELTKLDESKAVKSGELQSAVVLKDRANGEINRVLREREKVDLELDSVKTSVGEAEDMLTGLREASVDILTRSEKVIRVATEKRTEIEKQAKGIIPALKSQIARAKTLQSIYEAEIKKLKDKQVKAEKAELNYHQATKKQVWSEQQYRKTKRQFELLNPRLNRLISRAKAKVSEFISKIKLLEPMLSSISKAQAQLTKELTETRATKKSHDVERKLFKEWRKDLSIREKRVEDKEQSLRVAEEEFKQKGII